MAGQKKALPNHPPIEAGDVACNTCGTILKAKVVMGRNEVSHVEYTCKNEEAGCNYIVKRKIYTMAETVGLRPDGTPATVPV